MAASCNKSSLLIVKLLLIAMNSVISSIPTATPFPIGENPAIFIGDNQMWIDKMGSDSSNCNNKTKPCRTITYAYNCFIGNNGCDANGYDGNGIINLGDGDWYWPSDYGLIYADTKIIINGNGMNKTKLYYNLHTGIGCERKGCWLELAGLAIASNSSRVSSNLQITAKNGGTLRLSQVLFDGKSTLQNTVWMVGNDTYILLRSCIFKNINNDHYYISDGAYVEIINSQFIDIHFSDPLFEISSDSSVFVMNTTFENNTGASDLTAKMFYIENSFLTIDTSVWMYNYGMKSIITTNESVLSLSGTIFVDNQATYLLDITDYLWDITDTIKINLIIWRINISAIWTTEIAITRNIEDSIATYMNDSIYSTTIIGIQFVGFDSEIQLQIKKEASLPWSDAELDSIAGMETSPMFYDLIARNFALQWEQPDGSQLVCVADICESEDLYRFMASTDEEVHRAQQEFMNIWIDPDTFKSFECPSKDSKILITSSFFLNNQITSIMKVEASSLILEGDIINNKCTDFCVDVVRSSLLLDVNYEGNSNIIHFSPQSYSQSFALCVNGSDIKELDPYLVFDDTANIQNTMLMFNNCTEEFSLNYPEIVSNINATESYISSNPGEFAFADINCHENITSCSIHCNDTVSCVYSYFYTDSQATTVRCDADYACGLAHITAWSYQSRKPLESLHIICNAYTSCLQFVIEAVDVYELILDCVTAKSCMEVYVYISNVTFSEINCYSLSVSVPKAIQSSVNGSLFSLLACDGLYIWTDTDDTKLNMYQFSEGIVFSSPTGWTRDNLECDPLDAYIILNGDASSIDQGLSELFVEHPCEGIKFRCDYWNYYYYDWNPNYSCIIESIEKEINIDSFHPFSNYCQPIYFSDMSDIDCPGDCPNSPTLPPNLKPTLSPTKYTTPPTNAPTVSPSAAPTSPPTISPSTSPTNNPLATNDFDSFILITYVIDKLRSEDKATIYADPVSEIHEIEIIISKQYLIPDLIYSKNYLLQVLDVNGVAPDKIDANTKIGWTYSETFELNAQVDCDHFGHTDYCSSIMVQSSVGGENDFQTQVQRDLRLHTSNDELLFQVKQTDSLAIQCKNCGEQQIAVDYVLYTIITMVGLISLISILALLFNSKKFPKLPGFSPVDDGKWPTLLMFALQFWLGRISAIFTANHSLIDNIQGFLFGY